MFRALALACALLAPVLAPATASANGAVAGTVKLTGAPPALAPLKVIKDGSACGAEKPNEAVLVGHGGALANVIVSLKGAPGKTAAPPAPTANAVVDQVGCQYRPHVQAVTVGTAVTLVNSDRILHNVHGSAGPIQVFNMAMPIKGQRLPTRLTRPGLVRLQCDAGHTWMSAYIYVLPHPFFAVTDAEGHFEIKDVPPGHYTVEFWHEPVDGKGAGVTTTAEVTVKDGPSTHADAALKL